MPKKITEELIKIHPQTLAESPQRLQTTPAPDEWSPAQILAHIHPRDWAKTLGYARLSFAENFRAFDVGRHDLLRMWSRLSFEDWGRMALHEAQHCAQIETLLS